MCQSELVMIRHSRVEENEEHEEVQCVEQAAVAFESTLL